MSDFLPKFVPLLLSFLSGSAIVGLLGLRFQRLSWLHELFENFYNNDQYKGVRQKIDYEDVEQLLLLLDKSDSHPQGLQPEERMQVDQFTDYLNFFEWIAFLKKKHQLGKDHVEALFGYYIDRLLHVNEMNDNRLLKYIHAHGYEQLGTLLARYSVNSKSGTTGKHHANASGSV